MPQVPLVQTSVAAVQVVPQQCWPLPPHAVQIPPLPHSRPVPHALPLQQGWFAPPHGAQTAWLHTVVVSLHALPAQQGWFAPPQVLHMPATHAAPAAHSVPQHGCPAAPHSAQVLLALLQVVPLPHVAPAQQGWVLAPQETQVPPVEQR